MGALDPFDCVICGRHVDRRWPDARHQADIEPVCFPCERYDRVSIHPRGSFRDRRIARQIIALANALEGEARRAHYERFGYAAP